MPLPFRLLALVLLLAPLGAPGAVAQEARLLVFEAGWGVDHTLRVTLVSDQDRILDIVVTHEDPLVVHVVDRVTSISLRAGERQVANLVGLRSNVELTVHIVPMGGGPDRLPHAGLYDGASVARMAPLARVVVPPMDERDRVLRPDVHEAARFAPDGTILDYRPLVTSKGVLVAGYGHHPEGRLTFRVSRDGGHTWGTEHAFASAPNTGWSWGWAELATGEVRIVFHDTGSSFTTRPWRIVDLDTVRDAATERASAPNAIGSWWPSVVVLPDGTARVAEPTDGGARIWTIAPGATTRLAASVSIDAPVGHALLTGQGQRVALAYTTAAAGHSRLYLARSGDAGASFAPPQEMRSFTRAVGPGALSLTEAHVGTDGTAHLVASNESAEGFPTTYYHVRAPLAGSDATTAYASRGSMHLAVAGSRVAMTTWVVEANYAMQRLRESVDGGLTFTLGPRLDVAWGHTEALALLPDGRPLMMGATMASGSAPGWRGVGVALPYDTDPLGAPTFTVYADEPHPTPVVTVQPTTPTTVEPSAPTPVTPEVTTAPETVVEDVERVVLLLLPEAVRLSPGSAATVRALVTNLGTGERGSELPAVFGLPPGVQATVVLLGAQAGSDPAFPDWTTLPVGATREYEITLFAEVDAPHGAASATVAARHATDRAPVLATLAVDVSPAVAAGGSPVGALEQVPAAAWVLGSVGAAAGAVAMAARTDVGKIVAGAAALPLYSRIKRSDVLRHEVRAGIYGEIRSSPGARFEELRQGLALPSGVLTFHLGVLEREGYVRVSRDWTRRRYYAEGAPMPVAASTTEQTLESLLSREPGMGAGEVAKRLGISRQLARYHLKRLERQGWVRAEGEGAEVGYRLVRP